MTCGFSKTCLIYKYLLSLGDEASGSIVWGNKVQEALEGRKKCVELKKGHSVEWVPEGKVDAVKSKT